METVDSEGYLVFVIRVSHWWLNKRIPSQAQPPKITWLCGSFTAYVWPSLLLFKEIDEVCCPGKAVLESYYPVDCMEVITNSQIWERSISLAHLKPPGVWQWIFVQWFPQGQSVFATSSAWAEIKRLLEIPRVVCWHWKVLSNSLPHRGHLCRHSGTALTYTGAQALCAPSLCCR